MGILVANTMTQVGYINAEGGPLLVMDASVALLWKGVDEGGIDYKRACALFDKSPTIEGGDIPIGKTTGMVWEMKGPGTANIFTNSHLMIIRAWLVDPTDNAAVRQLAEHPVLALSELGQLTVSTGMLAILWAAENGKCIQTSADPPSGCPTGATTFETAGLVLKVKKGNYKCQHDQVETIAGKARRFHLLKKD